MKNKKNENFSEWFTEITQEAELCDLRSEIKGMVVNMPWAVMTMKKMYAIYEAELERRGHRPALFPALIPESLLNKESEHVEGFVANVLWVTHGGDKKLEEKYALRPTSETIIYKMYSLWIQGLKDLPLKIYQSCQVWRYETSATRPFIRGREFWWIEAHDAFATREQAEQQVRDDMEMTELIMHQQFGIPFMFFQRPQWDKFPGAENTYAADCLMPDGKIVQQPSTHMLGQKFSKAFDIKFMDENGKLQYAWQTCYGPCIWRIYASIIAQHGDDKGLIMPFALAPVQIIIVPIFKKENETVVRDKSYKIKQMIMQAGFRVDVDFSEQTPGSKFYKWEMKGVPIRIEIGEKEANSGILTLARRDSSTKEQVEESKLIAKITDLQETIRKNLVSKADDYFISKFFNASTKEELKEQLKKGGFVRIPFCSIDVDGKECADEVKAETVADVRGVPFDSNEKPKYGERCIHCGKPAKVYVYAGRQY